MKYSKLPLTISLIAGSLISSVSFSYAVDQEISKDSDSQVVASHNVDKHEDVAKKTDNKLQKKSDANDPSIYNQYYNFLQFNLMRSDKSRLPYGAQDTSYMEMEFGGRSGFIDLYGYVDVFDIFNESSDDRHGGDNMFLKIQPRFSLNGIFDKNLSLGPVKEWYISTLAEVGDNSSAGSGLFNEYIGAGADVSVPWLGKLGVNLYARYVRENYGSENENTWDGYKLATNWFKPVYTFSNGSFLSYQGYLDYSFGMKEYDQSRSKYALEWFNGLYWHNKSFAIGYGLKYFANMTGMKDGSVTNNVRQDTTGFGQYFDISYVFAQ